MRTIQRELINKYLKTRKIGQQIHIFEEVGSTNEVAAKLAVNGAPEGTVVIADSQTEGKGRLYRKWISPPGLNLYMSVILRPAIPAGEAPILTLVCSIAVCEAIKKWGGKPSIKWPNDVLIDKKKISGILTEVQIKADRIDFVVTGIGVNLNMTRETIENELGPVSEIATSLREATGKEVEKSEFTADLINQLEIWYLNFINYGKSGITKEWTDRWAAYNRRVRVMLNQDFIEGIALGVNENGYLIVRKGNGRIETVIAGDVVLL